MLKISFLGDSITEGAGAPHYLKSFVKLFEKKTGHIVFNYGVSGACFTEAEQKRHNRCDFTITNRAKEVYAGSDFIFVLGGTNDYGNFNFPIGKINDIGGKTFYGSLNVFCKNILKKFGV